MLLLLIVPIDVVGVANVIVVIVASDVVAVEFVNNYFPTQVSQRKSVITEAASSVLHSLRTHMVASFLAP